MSQIKRTYHKVAIAALAMIALHPNGAAATAGSQQDSFLATYKELVETDTSLSSGSCTVAASNMLARLKAAGFPANDARVIVPADLPKQGNLVARLPGSDTKAPAILLIAHIDVVEAKRSDWQQDPFVLLEKGDYYYGRGTVDDKAMAAAFVDMFVHYRQKGYRPRTTLKLALTCGEETPDFFNGTQYLLKNHPETLAAGYAINEGGHGLLDENGKPVYFGIQSGEKIYQNFKLVTSSPGGHSARPVKDNAISRLAEALTRLGAAEFPVAVSDVVRRYFGRLASFEQGQRRADMEAIGTGRADSAAYERIAAVSGEWNAMLRTTCVATMISGGHATNALPQHVEATVNCRILPGQTVDDIRKHLADVIADPHVQIEDTSARSPVSAAPALKSEILVPVERLVAKMWPGIPVIPSISPGATDGRFLLTAGIPTYGITGMFRDPDGNGVHGLNERVRVKSLTDSRTFLDRMVQALASRAPDISSGWRESRRQNVTEH